MAEHSAEKLVALYWMGSTHSDMHLRVEMKRQVFVCLGFKIL